MDPFSLAVLGILSVLVVALVYLRLQDSTYHGDVLDRMLSHVTERRAPPKPVAEDSSVVEAEEAATPRSSSGGEPSLEPSGAPSIDEGSSGTGGSEADSAPPSITSTPEEGPSESDPGVESDRIAESASKTGPDPDPVGAGRSSEEEIGKDGGSDEPSEGERSFFDPETGGVVAGESEPGEAADGDLWGISESRADESDGDAAAVEGFSSEESSPEEGAILVDPADRSDSAGNSESEPGFELAEGPLFEDAVEETAELESDATHGEFPDQDPREVSDVGSADADDTMIGYELVVEPSETPESLGDASSAVREERAGRGVSQPDSTPETEPSSPEEAGGFGVVDPKPSTEEVGDESSDVGDSRDGSSILGFEGPRKGSDSDGS